MDAIIRGGLRRYTDQVGHLWNSLADFYIRSGLFERARDVYEEAVQTITTVRDFTQVSFFSEFATISEVFQYSEGQAEVGNANTACFHHMICIHSVTI